MTDHPPPELIPPEQYAALGTPEAMCDGGDLDCGSGLLLIIRNHLQPLAPGGLIEIRSREISVREDLPAWCRLVGHGLLGVTAGEGNYLHFLLKKNAGGRATVADDLDKDLAAARNFVWRARVRWTGGMGGKCFVRNHSFPIGQPASFDTADPAPGAIEYALAALGGCLAVGFQWRASQRGITVRNCEISLNAKSANILRFLGIDTAEGHAGLTSVDGRLYVDADADSETLAELWRDTLARSPLAGTMQNAVALNIGFLKVE